MALRLVIIRAGVRFPLVMITSRNSEYRITIPDGAVLIHGMGQVNHPVVETELSFHDQDEGDHEALYLLPGCGHAVG